MIQQTKSINGIRRRVCPLCLNIVKYPEGVYFKKGIEAHKDCIIVKRRQDRINELRRFY